MYDCNCDSCKEGKELLELANGKSFKQVLKTAKKAFKRLYENGAYNPKDLLSTTEFKELINQTSDVFNTGISDNDIPAKMLKKLKEDVFLFSGLKTNAQLFEASRLLLDDEGKVRSYASFEKEVTKLNESYNRNYLEAEYEFAVTSSQMAGKWADTSDRYNLQYRTAADDRVRESHRALHGITLPKDDNFWLSYYPPNGWRCRCTAVEVRKGKYDESNSEDAQAKGESATNQIGADGKNKLEIFRFNPGITEKVFPPKHPYNKVQGAGEVKKNMSNDN